MTTTFEERNQTLGKELRSRRWQARLTLQQLGKISGVSPSHLARTERGERYPSSSILSKIAGPLGYGEKEILFMAGYLHDGRGTEAITSKIDPYVAAIIAREPLNVQRLIPSMLVLIHSVNENSKEIV